MEKIPKIYKSIIRNNKNVDDKVHLFFHLLSISSLEILTESRFTTVFILKMFHAFINGENIERIIYEVKNLEHPNENHSRTKPETQFQGTYLNGLWHKHYEGVSLRDMAINIRDQLKHSKTFNAEAFEIINSTKISDQQKVSMLGYLASGKQYLDRINDGRLTGHWLVYHIHNGKNYYLNLNIGNHAGDDEIIAREIKGVAVYEFPFLKGDLPILS